MNHEYTYVGAFLELRNIFTTKTEKVLTCPTHGEWGAKTKGAFCPECGSKIVSISKEVKCRKRFHGDWDGRKEDWVDKMFLASTDVDQKEDFMILLPNHRNSGQIQGAFEGEGNPICVIRDDMGRECIKTLNAKYAEYIDWLKKVREFEICTKFGIVKYWN